MWTRSKNLVPVALISLINSWNVLHGSILLLSCDRLQWSLLRQMGSVYWNNPESICSGPGYLLCLWSTVIITPFFSFLSLLLVSYVLIVCNILYERESKNSLTIMNSGRLWFSNAVYYFWKLKCPEIDDARSNLEMYNNYQTLHPSWKRTLTQCFKWIIWALWDK